jgi:hypothetical protein
MTAERARGLTSRISYNEASCRREVGMAVFARVRGVSFGKRKGGQQSTCPAATNEALRWIKVERNCAVRSGDVESDE